MTNKRNLWKIILNNYNYLRYYGVCDFLRKILKKLKNIGVRIPVFRKPFKDTALLNKYESIYWSSLKNSLQQESNEFVDYYPAASLQLPRPVNLIAFYLPQFHPIPENDIWWGKGFTEWTNVSKALPQYLGHYQPRQPGELGYYDLRIGDVQKRQVELAKKYGIFGFCFHYYWFNGKRLLEKPLELFVNNPDIDFPFCINWANENWTRRWDGQSNEILIAQEHSFELDKEIIHDFIKLFRHPNYIRVNNRPLLIVYRADILKEANKTLCYWRKIAVEEKVGIPYILAAQTFGYSDPGSDKFDGVLEFPPHNRDFLPDITATLTLLNSEYQGTVYRYNDFVNSSLRKLVKQPFKQFNTVMPGWDNEARRPGTGITFDGSTPKIFGLWLDAACQFAINNFNKEERYVFINAWNEWAEGAYLEPDRRFGYAYLQQTLDVLNRLSTSEKQYEIKE